MTGCREWMGGRSTAGYGVVSRVNRQKRVHRLVWELANGPIPENMVVMHTCDNPPCFLLAHLRLATQAGNMADKAAKGRTRGNRTNHPGRTPSETCGQGHPMHVSAGGKRYCIACDDIRRRKRAGKERP